MRVRRRTWGNPDVLNFCRRTGQPDPVEAIKCSARQLVAKSQIRQPPFSPFLMGRLQGILRVELRPIGFDACLVPVEGGFEVHICKDHSETRRNFSMAHEVGHLLMMDPGSVPKSALRETNIGFKVIDEEEYLCDIAASELLMPTPFFEEDAHDAGPSLSGVLELAALYKTSIAATVRRFVASGVWNCFFLVWKVTNESCRPRLKLDQVIENSTQIADRRAISLRDESHTLTALEVRRIVCGHEWLEFDGIVEGKYYIETIRLGSPGKPRLLSMVITEPAAGLWSRRRKATAYQPRLSRVW